VVEINKKLAQLSRKAAGEKGLVAGDLAPTGRFVRPFGDMPFEEAVDVYKEQVKAFWKAVWTFCNRNHDGHTGSKSGSAGRKRKL